MSDEAEVYIPPATWTEAPDREFTWQEIGAQAIWTDSLANPIEMASMRDVAIRGVRVMFHSYVAAGGPQVGHMETPRTWWDHWKVEHPRITEFMSPMWNGPNFRYEEHEFFARICPHLPRGDTHSSHVVWVSDPVRDAPAPTAD